MRWRCFQDCSLVAVLLLDRFLFLGGLVLEVAIKESIQGVADLGLCLPALVKDLRRGTICHRLLNRVGVYVGPEFASGLLIGDQRCSCEGDLWGIGQCSVDATPRVPY